MPRLQIEKNDDGDARLRGGRATVHRWTLVLTDDELAQLQRGERLAAQLAIPEATVKHLFIGVVKGAEVAA